MVIYRLYSTLGQISTKTPKIRQLRTVKKEVLKLMEMYIKRVEDLDAVYNSIIPPLLDAILGDYSANVPDARDAEVLNVMSTITIRLGVRYTLDIERCLNTDLLPSPVSPYTAGLTNTGSCFRANAINDQSRLLGIS